MNLPRVKPGVTERLLGGGQRELTVAAEVSCGLAVHVLLGFEVLDLRGDPRRIVAGVEVGDGPNPRDAFDEAGPDRLQVVPNRGYEAKSGDGHSATVGLCHRAQAYGQEVQTRLSLMLEGGRQFLDTGSSAIQERGSWVDARASSTGEPSWRHRPLQAQAGNLALYRQQAPLHA